MTLMPTAEDYDADMVLAFLLEQAERMNFLVHRLRERGVISEEDMAVVELQAEASEARRWATVAERHGDSEVAASHRAMAASLTCKAETVDSREKR
jgi:hypothetical protein